MSFDSLLNLTCNVQELTESQDGAGQMVKSWANIATGLACRLDTASGGLSTIPEVQYEAATHVLFMREISGTTISTKTHRIVVGSDAYTILRVHHTYGYSDLNHLEIELERDE